MISIKEWGERGSKKRDIYDEIISLSDLELDKNYFGANESNKNFERLPFGKELRQAFNIIASKEKINSALFQKKQFGFRYNYLEMCFLRDFYKTLMISIDSELKELEKIEFGDVKECARNHENKVKLEKIISNFNCKVKNNYYEFSNNGLIELYSGREYFNLSRFAKMIELEKKLMQVKNKLKRTKLKPGDESYEMFRKFIKKIIISKLHKDKDTSEAIIFDVCYDMDDDKYKKAKNKFYKWKQRNPDDFKSLVYEELEKLKPIIK